MTLDALHGLDQYEGTGKLYYDRPEIVVQVGGATMSAAVYAMTSSPQALRDLPMISEYVGIAARFNRSLHLHFYGALSCIQLKVL